MGPILPQDDFLTHEGILIAWTLRADFKGYKENLIKYMEKLEGREAHELRSLQKIWADQQFQLAMARQNQGQGQDDAHARLDRLERASSQLPASVTEKDTSAVPRPIVNESLASSPSFSAQTPRVLGEEITSHDLKVIQGKIGAVKKLLVDFLKTGVYPRIDELPKEAVADPEILLLWSRVDINEYRTKLQEFLETLLKNEEVERSHLRRIAAVGFFHSTTLWKYSTTENLRQLILQLQRKAP
ncbi:hypothetical protein BG011_005067 [Mortierella polycephala]|uniref:Uncharacterized protein n=1 Tax=Mortierella polycephala TaxID=41804 RepID=A0A9P6U1T6_9FUNG|nr:hypothetical protein BG011_005067 [Mortierella polycephala]